MGPRTVHSMFLAASLLAALPAHAVCGRTPPIHVWPRRGVPVPTNAHVIMTAPTTWRGDATLMLVTAPRKDRPSARVELREQAWKTAALERFDLTPAAPLRPSTAYELRSSRGEVLGAFTTSVMDDKRPPSWSGVDDGFAWKERKNVIGLECGSALLHVEGKSEALDDQTTGDDIRYALWAGKPGAPLDYTAPPLAWTSRDAHARGFELDFGSSIPESNDLELPADRPLRIGLKAYDLAGNASDPTELTVK